MINRPSVPVCSLDKALRDVATDHRGGIDPSLDRCHHRGAGLDVAFVAL